MKAFLKIALSSCALFVLTGAVNAQAQKATGRPVSQSTSLARRSAKAVVIVVGSAAKAGSGATKFAGKHVALPIAKTLFVKAAPAIGKFALKQSAKHLLPMILKMGAL